MIVHPEIPRTTTASVALFLSSLAYVLMGYILQDPYQFVANMIGLIASLCVFVCHIFGFYDKFDYDYDTLTHKRLVLLYAVLSLLTFGVIIFLFPITLSPDPNQNYMLHTDVLGIFVTHPLLSLSLFSFLFFFKFFFVLFFVFLFFKK